MKALKEILYAVIGIGLAGIAFYALVQSGVIK